MTTVFSAQLTPCPEVTERFLNYLEAHPHQRELSVLGLSLALQLSEVQRPHVLQVALSLASAQRPILEVRYRLYNASLDRAVEDVSQAGYANAITDGFFVDVDGYELSRKEFTRRAMPYFIYLGENVRCPHHPLQHP